ncbi:DNA mismatch repair protein MutS [Finegoldia magna]|uniref:DNA mismatch repair protein MutS n=1 Tax=Finegoldia magna TaxID=1260 RepID=UPI000B91C8D0|nr:DNA mismatch repair protein MutS [Finegoldia magna]OXZ41113.1 DNA mismatch repair protein MutS [Finegoldia magna]
MAYTPMIKQYKEIKEQNKDCILFFRLGDFYEMFFDDALIASKELEIVLTQRDCGENKKCPMCGIPYHVSDVYINKLVSKGYKVAICEQLEDPKLVKGLVKRGIIKIYTPATVIENENSDTGNFNYLMSISKKSNEVAISYIDISTGDVSYTNTTSDDIYIIIENEISKITPKEIIFNDHEFSTNSLETIASKFSIVLTTVNNGTNSIDFINSKIKYDNSNSETTNICVANLLKYVFRYQDDLVHINSSRKYYINEFMEIDSNSVINLEIQKNLYTNSKNGSLFGVLNHTKTSMGSRLLHSYLERPLMDKEEILIRQNRVEEIFEDYELLVNLENCLDGIYDLDRLLAKLSYKSANAKDLIALKVSIEKIPYLKNLLNCNKKNIQLIGEKLDDLRDIYDLIDKSIVDDPPVILTEGNLIKPNFSNELDQLRYNRVNGKNELVEYEMSEKDRLGIKNLKIVFNKKLGYFIDVTKSNLNKVGEDYEKRQTLTNSSRFKTKQLEAIESKILDSEDEIFELEYKIFEDIRKIILENLSRIKKSADLIAIIDVSNSLAKCAYLNNYIKPDINTYGLIDVLESRHPIVELSVGQSEFITNDILIGSGKNDIQLITGPNMSGKSTYLRQVALICILNQIGSFVPATKANISIVDKIFTRIGSSDNLFKGESTFMVEMKEMSNIIKYATSNSLLVLDEIGRGTSTFDGLSLAWAIVEYISKNIKAKTLFATHYHELTELEKKLDNLINMKVDIKETNDSIIFLRKITRGSTDKSYGIEVAELAGMPKTLIKRAKSILKEIDKEDTKIDFPIADFAVQNEMEDDKNIHELKDFKDEIKNINVNEITPIQSLQLLNELVIKASKLGD